MMESDGVPCLLLVDDEPALADLLKKYLERLGYRVDACNHPDAALELLNTQPQRYAVLVTDLTLPTMSGEELILRSRECVPGLRAIIASGYPYEPRVAGVEFLQKPFRPNLLAQAIERALKASAS
jgi:two-component system cell cycle sensor histidine kinase/response regulator CckA